MPTAITTGFPISRIRLRLVAVASVMKEICGALVRPRMEEEPAENPWQIYWGESYGPELKEWLLKPVFDALENEGKIGELIVDVGSGAAPVTELVQRRTGRKRVLVDIAADNGGTAESKRIRLDAEKIGEPGSLSYRKGLVRVCEFLGVKPRARRDTERADMMVFSDVLNYVDFEKVLGGFARFLKPGGRLVVSNLPMRGNLALFSEKGLKDNRELYQFLEGNGFTIETKLFPKRHPKETDEAEELIVLVARKG